MEDDVECRRCRGSGEVEEGDPCPICEGFGYITLSRDREELALQKADDEEGSDL